MYCFSRSNGGSELQSGPFLLALLHSLHGVHGPKVDLINKYNGVHGPRVDEIDNYHGYHAVKLNPSRKVEFKSPS